VRANTEPDNMPVVGMRVTEDELPHLKYVLSCQHTSATEEKQPTTIREVALATADELLKRLKDCPLPWSSWLQMHKVLAAEGKVPSSVDGLRGVQQAVERLTGKGLVTMGEGTMTCSESGDLPQGEALEIRLYPEEFFAADVPGDGIMGSSQSDSDGEYDEYEQDANFDEHFQQPEDGHEAERGNLADSIEKAPTPSKSWKVKDAMATPRKRGKGAAGAASAKRAKISTGGGRKKRKGASAGGDAGVREEADEALFESLFNDELEQLESDQRARKRQNAEMAEALFGGADGLEGEEEDEAAEEPTSEKGAWTYEVVGKKLGIRKAPDAENSTSSGHLSPGELFNVTERLAGSDGRIYLRLADGRGWAYDRSAKDFEKKVARLIVGAASDS